MRPKCYRGTAWMLAVQAKCLTAPGTAGETVRAAYVLEYGEDVVEMHVGAIQAGQRVLLVDDLIATGGTLGAGIKLMHQVGGPRASAMLGRRNANRYGAEMTR